MLEVTAPTKFELAMASPNRTTAFLDAFNATLVPTLYAFFHRFACTAIEKTVAICTFFHRRALPTVIHLAMIAIPQEASSIFVFTAEAKVLQAVAASKAL